MYFKPYCGIIWCIINQGNAYIWQTFVVPDISYETSWISIHMLNHWLITTLSEYSLADKTHDLLNNQMYFTLLHSLILLIFSSRMLHEYWHDWWAPVLEVLLRTNHQWCFLLLRLVSDCWRLWGSCYRCLWNNNCGQPQ